MFTLSSARSPAQRIKGQEVSILITTDGNLEDTLVDIQNFTLEAEFEIKSQGYLGEKSNRKDEVYNGCKFDFELHIHKQDWFVFQQKIKDRAQRNIPDTTFNITGVFAFPNGDTPTMLIPDCYFGPNPLNITSRGDYVKVKIAGEAQDFTVVES
jgi:hypothetical protein